MREDIGLVCVGPEQPLVDGVFDKFSAKGIRCVGPSSAGSIVESSKAWSKHFMSRHNIPTARYCVFTDVGEALEHVRSVPYDVVIKVSLTYTHPYKGHTTLIYHPIGFWPCCWQGSPIACFPA